MTLEDTSCLTWYCIDVLSHVSSIFSFFSQCESLKSGSYCIGNQLVYRLSFSIGSFFALTGLLTTIIARCCDTFCSFLCIQVPCYLLLVAGSLFLPKGTHSIKADAVL